MEFKKILYRKAYLKAINGISDAIQLLETEHIITEINLNAVRNLKEMRKECENIFLNDGEI